MLAWYIILYIIIKEWEGTFECTVSPDKLSPGAKDSLPDWSPATGLSSLPAGCQLRRCFIINLQYHMHVADNHYTKCHFYEMCKTGVAARYLRFEHKYFNTVFCTEPTVLKTQLYKTLHLAFTVGCFKGLSSFLLSPSTLSHSLPCTGSYSTENESCKNAKIQISKHLLQFDVGFLTETCS